MPRGLRDDGAGDADTFVDITDTVERKIDALRSHVSQMPDPDGVDARIRAWAEATARQAGFAPGALAEGFLRVDTQ